MMTDDNFIEEANRENMERDRLLNNLGHDWLNRPYRQKECHNCECWYDGIKGEIYYYDIISHSRFYMRMKCSGGD
jgi:hypothetical protein